MTKQELEKALDSKVKAGKMSADEAELEYQDFMHRDEVWQEW